MKNMHILTFHARAIAQCIWIVFLELPLFSRSGTESHSIPWASHLGTPSESSYTA